jgi:hypothetical protein
MENLIAFQRLDLPPSSGGTGKGGTFSDGPIRKS